MTKDNIYLEFHQNMTKKIHRPTYVIMCKRHKDIVNLIKLKINEIRNNNTVSNGSFSTSEMIVTLERTQNKLVVEPSIVCESLLWYAFLCVISSFAIILTRKRTDCFAFIVFWMYCYSKCPVALPQCAMGWSAVCNYGIF